MTHVFFITGTSGSGKSTILPYLKKALPKHSFAVHDFDEVGVPDNADKEWRLKTTTYWLEKAQENIKQQKATVICGVVVPSEVQSVAKSMQMPIHFGYLKINDTIIKERLIARGWGEQLIIDNINWAHYLESEVKQQADYCIIEASHSNPDIVAKKCIAWILSHYDNQYG